MPTCFTRIWFDEPDAVQWLSFCLCVDWPLKRDASFLCIGSARSAGDSLGPRVGTALRNAGVPRIYGTLEQPVHAANLDSLPAMPANTHLITVDAALGRIEHMGSMCVGPCPLHPGVGVGKSLPAVGDASITAVVNTGGSNAQAVLDHTPLSLITDIAASITQGILQAIATHQEVTAYWRAQSSNLAAHSEPIAHLPV